jgi:hypothetical protein
MKTTRIECLCGTVKVELLGEPKAEFYCHCDDCQAAHGAAYLSIQMYPAAAVNVIEGNPLSWRLKATPRATCSACGTRVFAEPPGLGIRGVNAYLLPAGTFRPTMHIFCKFARCPVKDDLPHFATVPVAFGGSGETIDW